MRGLDPRIHQDKTVDSRAMDCWVKPGNDEGQVRGTTHESRDLCDLCVGHPAGSRPLALNTGAAAGAIRNLMNAFAGSGSFAFAAIAVAKDVVS